MNPSRRKAILIVVVVGIGSLISGKLFVPWLIEQVYEGKSLSILNSVITGQVSHPVSFYLDGWGRVFRWLMWVYLIGGALGVYLFDVMTRPTVYTRVSACVGDVIKRGKPVFRVLVVMVFTMASGYVAPVLPHVAVTVSEMPVGIIKLGTGWNTWDHWYSEFIPRFRLTWTDDQWASYLGLLKESGGDWIRLDYNYADTEPRNDNSDPTVIDWNAFTFDSPGLSSLYRMLDFCQAHHIDVYLTHTYLRSNHVYNADRRTGWLSQEAVSKGFPVLWTRPKDEPVDKRELAENLAATTYFLIKKRHYTVIKQVALYVEPDAQWTNVDGFRDTVFLGELLTKLGIRDEVAILAPHSATWPAVYPNHTGAPVSNTDDMSKQNTEALSNPGIKSRTPEADYNIFAIEDYASSLDWTHPEQGLKNLDGRFKTIVGDVKKGDPLMEVALMEYGKMWNEGATDPLPSYLSSLSAACLVFELYNAGFAGTQRWSFDPVSHPYLGFAVVKPEGVQYSAAATEVIMENTIPVIAAMEKGATFVKVPQTFEPQRLVNMNLQRGATVYRTVVADSHAPGKGVCAIAAKTPDGTLRVGLINFYPHVVDVVLTLKNDVRPLPLRWDYYDANFPSQIVHRELGLPGDDRSLNLRMSPRSLNFLFQ